MILFPVVNMPIFLVLRGLASRAHVSDDHGLLLTSARLISVFGQPYHRNRWASITWPSLPERDTASANPDAEPPLVFLDVVNDDGSTAEAIQAVRNETIGWVQATSAILAVVVKAILGGGGAA